MYNMATWKIKLIGKKPKLNNPVLIEGLPGIGNVGKIVVDFLIEELKAKKLFDITSHTFPHSVFINEDNLVELPKIEVYYIKGKRDLFFLAGDVQPIDEVSSYEFADKILDMAKEFKCKEIITLGGIGLSDIPKKPKIYCTANNKAIIKRYKNGIKLEDKLYGTVGPIIGVTGLLLGLADRRKIPAISFLAETYSHPMYLGIKGAREILTVLKNNLKLKINLNKLDKEIKTIDKEMMRRTEQLSDVTKKTAIGKLKTKIKEVDYIG